ncbi:hypothetical protein IID62_08710, partial [candidate division KSB1 bacterium]|nr:hypothetical protein [candidate division KSB1 bacterium]
GRPSAGNPEYPSAAVNIDYYLAEPQTGEFTLEIHDSNGILVRAFSSEAEGERWEIPEEISMREFRLERAGTPRLPNSAGMNRFRWNMTHAGAWNQNRAGSGGPMVVPGTYQVRLSVGNWSSTEEFEVLADPRVTEDGITQNDFVEQLSLCLKVRDLMSNARQTVEQIRIASSSADRGAGEKLTTLRSKFLTASGRYQTPMLVDQISYLNSMLNRADQKPGRDAYERFDELNGLLSDYLNELRQILNNR